MYELSVYPHTMTTRKRPMSAYTLSPTATGLLTQASTTSGLSKSALVDLSIRDYCGKLMRRGMDHSKGHAEDVDAKGGPGGDTPPPHRAALIVVRGGARTPLTDHYQNSTKHGLECMHRTPE